MNNPNKISYFAKESYTCPVCEEKVVKEEPFSGGGRIIAGELTDELRRLYEPSKKYGDVYPLIYPVMVCPSCLFAAYASDFQALDSETAMTLNERRMHRQETMQNLLGESDFTGPRSLRHGLASYMLAVSCYDAFPYERAPSFKCGLSCLRAAWLSSELHRKYPLENYDYLAQVFYRKANFYYGQTIVNEQSGKEDIGQIGFFGPDTDQNYGFEGVLYLAGLLEFRYGAREPGELRQKNLEKARSSISRIVGMGKSSKSKPSALLDLARDLHKLIGSGLKAEDE